MSSKAKTIAICAAALVAIAGGIYSFMPADQDHAASASEITGLAKSAVKPVAEEAKGVPAQKAEATQPQEKAKVQTDGIATMQPPVAVTSPVAPATKKLTRQQVTPPEASTDEKLQKAAEEENNF